VRLVLKPGGHAPDGEYYSYFVRPRDADAKETSDEIRREHLASILPRVSAMAKLLFNENLVRAEMFSSQRPSIHLLFMKGTSTRNAKDFIAFKGWLSLFTIENYSPQHS
jgi:predicted GTPase